MKKPIDLTTESLIALTRRFIQFPSEQTEAMEHAPAVQDFVSDCAAPLIAQAGLVASRDALGNLLVTAGPAGADHAIAFFSYAMTHPRARMSRPFDGEVIEASEGPCMRGRGISEQKAAMAAALAAFLDLACARTAKQRFSWVLLTAGETGRHDAVEAAIERLPLPRFAILTIGTGCAISLGHRGRLDVEVVIQGKSGHSSAPWLGIDTIPGVCELLARAQGIHSSLGRDAHVGPGSLVCTSIRTWPEATHTLQGEARLVFDRRLLPDESPDEVFETLHQAFSLPPPLVTRVKRGPFMYGCGLAPDCTLATTISRALLAADLPIPATFYSAGALDAGCLVRRGVETLAWGPGDSDQFHGDDEHVRIADLVLMAQSYRALLRHIVES